MQKRRAAENGRRKVAREKNSSGASRICSLLEIFCQENRGRLLECYLTRDLSQQCAGTARVNTIERILLHPPNSNKICSAFAESLSQASRRHQKLVMSEGPQGWAYHLGSKSSHLGLVVGVQLHMMTSSFQFPSHVSHLHFDPVSDFHGGTLSERFYWVCCAMSFQGPIA